MISEEQARAKILEQIMPLPHRQVALDDALNAFVARDYFARISLPAFDNSAMDGYAVVSNSCGLGGRLRVVGEQPAGRDRHLRIVPGEAVRIFTGAPIPAGADAIVMQEDVTLEAGQVVLNLPVAAEDFIRRRGCDLVEGQKIVTKGDRVRPTNLALLASQGFAQVEIGGKVTAAILSTGDELVRVGQEIAAGQIYESNSVLLQALLEQIGAKVEVSEHSPDEKEALTEAIRRGAQARVLIISGGVSVGEHDLVKSVLVALGGKIDLWRVAIKPGKPFLFGRLDDCAVFGLPGNPVSAFVTFLQFVRPAILKMMGARETELGLRKLEARLAVELENAGDRAHYFRGKLESGAFTPIGRQESHALFGLSQSNALLRVAPETALKAGVNVMAEVWD